MPRGEPPRRAAERGEVVRVEPEKPWDEERKSLDIDNGPIPQPDLLMHNSTYFRTIKGLGFPRRPLEGLADYF